MISKVESREFVHEAIVDECMGCSRVVGGENVCAAYLYPATRWKNGKCALGTHIETEAEKPVGKKRVGQQKQKKH